MARGTFSFAEKERRAGGRVARRHILDGGGGEEAKKSDEFLQLSFRELESGHARSRNPFADQFSQFIHRASAGSIGGDNVWASLSPLAIRAVTGGAADLEVTLTLLTSP